MTNQIGAFSSPPIWWTISEQEDLTISARFGLTAGPFRVREREAAGVPFTAAHRAHDVAPPRGGE